MLHKFPSLVHMEMIYEKQVRYCYNPFFPCDYLVDRSPSNENTIISATELWKFFFCYKLLNIGMFSETIVLFYVIGEFFSLFKC